MIHAHRWLTAPLCVGLALLLQGSACNRVARQHPLSLDDDVFSFHQAIKNKDFRRASSFMDPKWRDGFDRAWRNTKNGAEFLELEVIETRKTEDAEYAHVEAQLRYVVSGTLNTRDYTFRTLWKGEGTGWFIDGAVDPPPEFRLPAAPENATPPAAAPAPQPAPGAEPSFGGG